MVFQTQEVLFVSLNNALSISFERYVKQTHKEFIQFYPFHLIRNTDGSPILFSHVLQISHFLENLQLERLSNLIIIIDSYSIDVSDDLIKELILKYPEVKTLFLSFDGQWIKKFHPIQIRCNLTLGEICSNKNCRSCLENGDSKPYCRINLPYIHNFNPLEENEFDLIVCGKSNLFDASNLRNYIKQDFYKTIHVQSNYPKNQCSRLNHFALSIEDEISLAYYNGYALYANGYSSLPIISCLELKTIRENTQVIFKDKHTDLIIRDYDLQFEDYNGKYNLHQLRGIQKHYFIREYYNPSDYFKEFIKILCETRKTLENSLVNNKNVKTGLTYIDKLQSILVLNEDDQSKLKKLHNFKLENVKGKKTRKELKNITYYLNLIMSVWIRHNDIWENFNNEQTTTYFLTRLSQTPNTNEPYINNQYFINNHNYSGLEVLFKNGNPYAVLRGINKPHNGIYALTDISEIHSTYLSSRDNCKISIKREGSDGHSVPPFLFHIADSLIKRSQGYYDSKMYMLSALLAKEASEILNGFHLMLSLEALYQLAIAEACLITESLGVEENSIAKNTKSRLKDISDEVERLCGENEQARKNVLTQIYNDIRHIFKDKEQFKSADIALEELISTRFGNNLWKQRK